MKQNKVYRLRFLINRSKKIERNKKKRKNKRYEPYKLPKWTTPTNKILQKSQNFKLLKTLHEKRFYKKTSSNKIIIPKTFCLIRNPEQSLDTLQEINYIITRTKNAQLFLDYSNCSFLGLGASIVTDAIILAGQEKRGKERTPIRLSGNYPNSYEAMQIFTTSGLLEHLNINKNGNTQHPQIERLDPFIKYETSNEMTNNVINYYNRCLQRNGYELTPEGINHFNGLAGEIIDNLMIHSGNNGVWYVSGHFKQNQDQSFGKGSLVFISIGNSIYESLKTTDSQEILNKLDKYTKKQYGKIITEKIKERAWTVLSLQYKISRFNNQTTPDRGTGTIKFIESFTKLGNTYNNDPPLMSILSGKTQIIFDGTYKIQELNIGNSKIPIIAFNEENDIRKKPDPKAVKTLKNSLPGVIINIEFYVDKQYLTKQKQG